MPFANEFLLSYTSFKYFRYPTPGSKIFLEQSPGNYGWKNTHTCPTPDFFPNTCFSRFYGSFHLNFRQSFSKKSKITDHLILHGFLPRNRLNTPQSFFGSPHPPRGGRISWKISPRSPTLYVVGTGKI